LLLLNLANDDDDDDDDDDTAGWYMCVFQCGDGERMTSFAILNHAVCHAGRDTAARRPSPY